MEGLITLHDIRAVPRGRQSQLTASQIMTPVDALFVARSDEDVLTLLRRMDEADVSQVPVAEDGSLSGMFSRRNLVHYMQLRSELGV